MLLLKRPQAGLIDIMSFSAFEKCNAPKSRNFTGGCNWFIFFTMQKTQMF